MANILIVEDEKNMQDIIAEYIKKGGHTCFTADDGIEALMILKNNPMDLMILDIMMPHIDGFTVCKMAREMSNMPVIMLTAKSEESDKLKGYEYGADDYTTKPFSPKVLLAKVNALLRRSTSEPLELLSAGKISVMPSSHKVFLDGQEISLTHKEYELLYFFMRNPGQVFTREQLLNRIWGSNYDTEEPCACYDHAARRLLGPRYTPLRRQFDNVCYEVRPTAGDVLLSTGGTDPYRIAETLLTILYPEYGPADCGSAAGSLSLLRERFYAMQPARFKSESLPLLRSLHYHVLTSRSNTRYEALQALAQVCPSIHIHTDVKEVAALMASCDLAVSAGGTTLCELCAVGVPSVSYLMAENQRTVVESYEKKQLIPCAGDIRSTDRSEIPADSVSCCVHNSAANVSAHPDRENAVLPDLHTIGRILGFLADMTQNAAARAAVSAAMRNFLDGSGADRIAAALIQ